MLQLLCNTFIAIVTECQQVESHKYIIITLFVGLQEQAADVL